MFVKKSIPGSFIKQTGPVSFKVTLQDGKTIHCHQDQLRKRDMDETKKSNSPLLTDDNLSMFTGRETIPEVTTESIPVGTECQYPSRSQRPPARYRVSHFLRGRRCSDVTVTI